MKQLFCDCKTDEEKANFFLSGRAVETGIIAPAISNDVSMAYHRCAEFQKEIDALRTKIEQMEKQGPVVEVQWAAGIPNGILDFISTDGYLPKLGDKLYARPGAKGEEK